MLRNALLNAIKKTLQDCGTEVPEINDDTVAAAIRGFDSQVWPYAMNLLKDCTWLSVPADANIFLSKTKPHLKLRIDQIVDRLMEYVVARELSVV